MEAMQTWDLQMSTTLTWHQRLAMRLKKIFHCAGLHVSCHNRDYLGMPVETFLNQ